MTDHDRAEYLRDEAADLRREARMEADLQICPGCGDEVLPIKTPGHQSYGEDGPLYTCPKCETGW